MRHAVDDKPAYTQGAMGYLGPFADMLGAITKIFTKPEPADPTAPDFTGALAYVMKSVPHMITQKELIVSRALNPNNPDVFKLKVKGNIHKKLKVMRGKEEVSPEEYKAILSHLLNAIVLGETTCPDIAKCHFVNSNIAKLAKFNLLSSLTLTQGKAAISVETVEEYAAEKKRQLGPLCKPSTEITTA